MWQRKEVAESTTCSVSTRSHTVSCVFGWCLTCAWWRAPKWQEIEETGSQLPNEVRRVNLVHAQLSVTPTISITSSATTTPHLNHPHHRPPSVFFFVWPQVMKICWRYAIIISSTRQRTAEPNVSSKAASSLFPQTPTPRCSPSLFLSLAPLFCVPRGDYKGGWWYAHGGRAWRLNCHLQILSPRRRAGARKSEMNMNKAPSQEADVNDSVFLMDGSSTLLFVCQFRIPSKFRPIRESVFARFVISASNRCHGSRHHLTYPPNKAFICSPLLLNS